MQNSGGQTNAFIMGAKDCLPTLLGYISIGLACGVIGTASSLTVWQVTVLALLVYAGSAQMVMAGLLMVHTPFIVIVFTVAMINLRMLLLSMTIAPHFKTESLGQRFLLGVLLTDESFGVAMLQQAKKPRQLLNPSWMMGLNVTAYSGWCFACFMGAYLGDLLPNPTVLGLDFALVAMFIALLVLQLELVSRHALRAYLIALASAVVLMLLLLLFLPASVSLLLGTITGAIIGGGCEK